MISTDWPNKVGIIYKRLSLEKNVAERHCREASLTRSLGRAIVRQKKTGFVTNSKRGYEPVVLSRAIGDTGSVTSALIPWKFSDKAHDKTEA